MKSNTAVAILVGGKGTRLSPLELNVAKPLAPVLGKPFLAMLIEKFSQLNIQKFVLLTGYGSEEFVKFSENYSTSDLNIVLSQENIPLGTAGALKNAERLLSDYEHVLLINGDTYFEGDLGSFIDSNIQNECMMGVQYTVDVGRFGLVKHDVKTGNVLSFSEKTQQQKAGFVNAGIYKFSTSLIQYIPENKFFSFETEFLPILLEKGVLKAKPIDGSFYDIGIPESYADFNLYTVLKSTSFGVLAKIVLLALIFKKKLFLILERELEKNEKIFIEKLMQVFKDENLVENLLVVKSIDCLSELNEDIVVILGDSKAHETVVHLNFTKDALKNRPLVFKFFNEFRDWSFVLPQVHDCWRWMKPLISYLREKDIYNRLLLT